jgi:hypothetical protein
MFGVRLAVLLENVGDPNVISNDVSTCFMNEGAFLTVTFDGEKTHPTTGLPLLELTDCPELRQRQSEGEST